jgi:hypothetical protein
MDQINLRS